MVKRRAAHELAVNVPPERLAEALVRELALIAGGQVIYRYDDRVVAVWPPGERVGAVISEPVGGGGLLYVNGARRWGNRERIALRETVSWLGILTRLDQLSGEHGRAQTRAHALRTEAMAGRARLVRVRELERRRLVGAVTATTLRDLARVRTRIVKTHDPPDEQELASVRDALDDLLDDFRVIVRGVYPALLADRGPRVALEELAATLSAPVRFTGELGRRVDWQLESGLYHAVAAVLAVLADGDDATALTVEMRRDEALRVRITATTGLGVEQLRKTWEHDAERVALFNGALECVGRAGGVEVNVRVPVRVELDDTDGPLLGSDRCVVYRRVWELVQEGKRFAGERPDRSRWEAVASQLARPMRLAVIRDPAGSAPNLTRAAALGVTVLDIVQPADRALARELLVGHGPHGTVDAVLCLAGLTAEFRVALCSGPQRVELRESASPVDLARRLVAWAPVIAARRAVVVVRELVSQLPADHPLQRSIERIAVEAYEFDELELLDELEREGTPVFRGTANETTASAKRLLGAEGTDPRNRLGLIAGASDREIRRAAASALRQWRLRAGGPAIGGRDRLACEILARTAERLFTVEGTP